MNQPMVSDTMAFVLRLEKRRLPVRIRTLFENRLFIGTEEDRSHVSRRA